MHKQRAGNPIPFGVDARSPRMKMAKKTKKNLTKEQEQAMKQLEDLATEIHMIYGVVASGTNDLRPKPYDLQTCVTLTDASR
ncbi:hypothetical protein TYRP_020535 [Tyrophagus putrescentiae]|nr:hypothetical protein TYRP_020535 [Tyrophagus putrescentiae]